jgi:hypothetical protein
VLHFSIRESYNKKSVAAWHAKSEAVPRHNAVPAD